MNYKDLLEEMGYSNIMDNGRELRTKPIYRDSSSNTVLSIRKDTGTFIDFSKQISGSFADLVKISLGMKDVREAKDFLEKKGALTVTEIKKPEVKAIKTFPKEYLNKLVSDHSYWINRGVEESTIKIFEGGIAQNGTMKNRYVFPIFNSSGELIGVSGRKLEDENDSTPKWKHKGNKSHWKYPLKNNHKIIKEKKKVVLIESIGDMLSLWQAGIRHTVVTFGLDVSIPVLNLLLKLDPNKIFISFNNDSNNNSAGNIAAEKAKKKLSKYFDNRQLCIKLPTKKDFGEMDKEEIMLWAKNKA